ncbi:hypothetical protein [Massilia endophytica]|uniref:hypothetical protein n=1 Tax=Massilia endophytica TaxID=2899220 RepID=UPI001E3CC5E4|nr:hypothetical protein [Massilia endophytica]UGQ45536.1 hypothetical protein LSQ66_17330 [Massilia endophytica]
MNDSSNTAMAQQKAGAAQAAGTKPLRSERMAARGVDLRKKNVRTGTYAAGGLLALVGLAAVLLG